jgi:hypothetical protein
MSEFKIGEEVQILGYGGVWQNAIYCGEAYGTIYLNTSGKTHPYAILNSKLRRKPRAEKRMMQWLRDDRGNYMAFELAEAQMRPYCTPFGEPFEQTFEVPE